MFLEKSASDKAFQFFSFLRGATERIPGRGKCVFERRDAIRPSLSPVAACTCASPTLLTPEESC